MIQVRNGDNCIVIGIIFFVSCLFCNSQTRRISSSGDIHLTNAIVSVVNSEVDTLIIEKRADPWLVSPIRLRNVKDKVLVFEEGVILKAKPGSFPKTNDCFIELKDCKGIIIEGNGAKILMNKEEYSTGEWRHGFSIRGSERIEIRNITVSGSGGDGVYVAGSGQNLYSEEVIIKGVTSINNKRQGMSIISAKNLEIIDCSFLGTNGTLPNAGLDIEPNRPQDIISGIRVKNCNFENNLGAGILIALSRLNKSSKPISVSFSECLIRNNNFPNSSRFGSEIVLKANKDNPVEGELIFTNCLISDAERGFLYSRKRADAYAVVFKDCMIDNVGKNGTSSLILLEVPDYKTLTGPLGGFDFNRLYIKDMKSPNFVTVRGSKRRTLEGLKDVHGQFIIDGQISDSEFINYINYHPSLNENVNLELIFD